MRYVLALLVVGLLAGGVSAQAYVVYSPVAPAVYAAPAPVYTTAYYAPPVTTAYYSPVRTTAYYAPAPAPVAVTPVYATRYRPFLGGSITRVRYYYAPVAPVTYVAPAPVVASPCCH